MFIFSQPSVDDELGQAEHLFEEGRPHSAHGPDEEDVGLSLETSLHLAVVHLPDDAPEACGVQPPELESAEAYVGHGEQVPPNGRRRDLVLQDDCIRVLQQVKGSRQISFRDLATEQDVDLRDHEAHLKMMAGGFLLPINFFGAIRCYSLACALLLISS